MAQVDFTERSLKVMGKGNRQLVKYAPAWAFDALNAWLELRRSCLPAGQEDDHFLFNRIRRGNHITRDRITKHAIYFIATRLLREAGAGPTLVVSPLLALMRDQVAERVKVLRGLIEAAQAALTALDDEESALRQQAQQAIASIRAGFENMRLAAAADLAAATQRLNQEADAVAQRRKKALAEAEAERDTELAAAGVDPARVQKLTDEIASLAKSLDGISRNRHHVKAWREFQVGLLPALRSLCADDRDGAARRRGPPRARQRRHAAAPAIQVSGSGA